MKSLDCRCSISHRNPNGHSIPLNPILNPILNRYFQRCSIYHQPTNPKIPLKTSHAAPSPKLSRSLPPSAPVPTRRPWALGFPPAAPAARRSSGSRTPRGPWRALGRRSWETPGGRVLKPTLNGDFITSYQLILRFMLVYMFNKSTINHHQPPTIYTYIYITSYQLGFYIPLKKTGNS